VDVVFSCDGFKSSFRCLSVPAMLFSHCLDLQIKSIEINQSNLPKKLTIC